MAVAPAGPKDPTSGRCRNCIGLHDGPAAWAAGSIRNQGTHLGLNQGRDDRITTIQNQLDVTPTQIECRAPIALPPCAHRSVDLITTRSELRGGAEFFDCQRHST